MWKTCDPGQLFVLGSHKKNKTVLPIEFFNCGYCCRTSSILSTLQTKYVGLSMGPDTTNARPLPSSIIRAFKKIIASGLDFSPFLRTMNYVF